MPTQYQRQPKSKTREQILKEIEERLRVNKGGFSTFAEPTSSTPWRVAGRRGQEPFAKKPVAAPEPFAPPAPPQAPPVEQQLPEDQMSAIEFFLMLNNQVLNPSNPSPEHQEYLRQLTGNAGLNYTPSGQETWTPIASWEDGGTLYQSDTGKQEVRYIPQYVTSFQSSILSGLPALMEILFGQQRPVTQEYGNYNPAIEPTGYNIGTDIRTIDLPEELKRFYLPFTAKVAQVFEDDGSNPYGNSVLLQLSNGEKIRLSHLEELGNFKAGDNLNPYTYLGKAGATGNVTGPHLDLEFYDANGQLSNPNKFILPEIVTEMISKEPMVIREAQGQPPLYSQPPAQTPTQSQQQTPLFAQEAANAINKLNPTGTVEQGGRDYGLTELAQGNPDLAAQKLGGTAANAINRANLTGKAGLGISEMLQGNPEAAKQERLQTAQSGMGTQLTNPFAKMVKSVRQGLGNTVEAIGNAIPGLPEGYFSEAIAGGPTKGTGVMAAEEPTGAIASGPFQNYTPKDQFQPGAGVSKLFSSGAGLFSRPSTTDISPKLALGNIAGADMMTPMKGGKQEQAPNDIRDQFFKTGMSEQFKDKMIPNAETAAGGALTTDLFTPEFYQDINNVNQVFSDSSQVQKAVDLFKQQFRQKFSGEDYDQQEVEGILSQISNLPKNMSINISEPHKRQKTLEDYLRAGKSAAQWYTETGQQSSLDAIRSNPRATFDDRTGSISYVGNDPAGRGYAGGSTPQTNAYESNRRAGGISYGSQQNYTPAFANMTSAYTGQPAYAPPPQINTQPVQSQGIFQRIKNWFQRR